MIYFRTVILFLLLILLPLTGCGTGTNAVTGTATYDGQLIETGSVSLIPINDMAASGASATIENGKFSVPAKFGVVPGQYRVGVQATDRSKVLQPATTDVAESYAPLFPNYSFDHTFPAAGPYTLDISVPLYKK